MTTSEVTQILSAVIDVADDGVSLPQRLVLACAAALPVTGVGMMLMTDAGPAGVVGATSGPAMTMENLQFTLGEGPCVDCSTTGRPVLVADLAASGPPRWPAFSAGALDVGIRAIFAMPLRVGAIRLGVLDLYRDAPGPLPADDLARALSFADAATAVLLHLQAQDPGDDLAGMVVIDDRATVHQATGFIAGRAGMSMTQALVLLRARSFASGQLIHDLAESVLAGELWFSTDETGIHLH